MDVADHGELLVVRLDPGETVLESLRTLRRDHDLDGAFVTGIGAVDRVTLGHYDVETQDYREDTREGQFEVTSFVGNIGPDKIHAHITVGDEDYRTLSGHCSGARVSGTFELLVHRTPATLSHRHDTRTGLDVLDL